MTTAVRTEHRLGKRDGYTTLEQRFRFDGVDATAVTSVLMTAPLVGADSIFGNRPGTEVTHTAQRRSLQGFSPAPAFRFNVDMELRNQSEFVVRFTQPLRRVPYLQGSFLWTVTDEGDGAVFDEQMNTARALAVSSEPLGGPRPSLRRWLFFRAGHKQVMANATGNIASLLVRS